MINSFNLPIDLFVLFLFFLFTSLWCLHEFMGYLCVSNCKSVYLLETLFNWTNKTRQSLQILQTNLVEWLLELTSLILRVQLYFTDMSTEFSIKGNNLSSLVRITDLAPIEYFIFFAWYICIWQYFCDWYWYISNNHF